MAKHHESEKNKAVIHGTISKPLVLFGSMNKQAIKEAIKEAIKTDPNLTAIKAISFKPEQLKALSDLGNLPNINTLILVNYPLDYKDANGQFNSAGIKALAQLSNFPNLTELNITLGASSSKELDLYRFNSKNIEYIKNSPILNKLSKLNIVCKKKEIAEAVKKILEYLAPPQKLENLTINGQDIKSIDPTQEEQLAQYCFQNDICKIVGSNLLLFNKLQEFCNLLKEVCQLKIDPPEGDSLNNDSIYTLPTFIQLKKIVRENDSVDNSLFLNKLKKSLGAEENLNKNNNIFLDNLKKSCGEPASLDNGLFLNKFRKLYEEKENALVLKELTKSFGGKDTPDDYRLLNKLKKIFGETEYLNNYIFLSKLKRFCEEGENIQAFNKLRKLYAEKDNLENSQFVNKLKKSWGEKETVSDDLFLTKFQKDFGRIDSIDNVLFLYELKKIFKEKKGEIDHSLDLEELKRSYKENEEKFFSNTIKKLYEKRDNELCLNELNRIYREKDIKTIYNCYAKHLFFELVIQAGTKGNKIDESKIDSKERKELERIDKEIYIKHMFKHREQYRFYINSLDESGYQPLSYCKDNEKIQELLLQHGAIPERDKRLQRQEKDGQSAHGLEVELKNKFYAQKLVKATNLDSGHYLKQTVLSNLIKDIEKLEKTFRLQDKLEAGEQFSDPTKVYLLNITKEEQSNVSQYVPPKAEYLNNPGFRKQLAGRDAKVINRILEQEVGREEYQADKVTFVNNVFKYVTAQLQDNSKFMNDTARLRYKLSGEEAELNRKLGTATFYHLPVFEILGRVHSYIKTIAPSIEDKKHLCANSFSQKPEEVKKKFDQIRELIASDCTAEQLTNEAQCYHLLQNTTSESLDQVFRGVNDIDIKEVWKGQKLFSLVKEIFLATTEYNNRNDLIDPSICIEGMWTHILELLDTLDPSFFEEYIQEQEAQNWQNALIAKINEKNVSIIMEIKPTVEDLQLIQFVNDHLELKPAFAEVIFDNLDVNNLKKEQQLIFDKIKELYLTKELPAVIQDIRKVLHNYDNKDALSAGEAIKLPDRAKELINFVKEDPKLKGAFVNVSAIAIDIKNPETISIEEEAVLGKIYQLYLNPTKLKILLPNHESLIPDNVEYEIVVKELAKLPLIKRQGLQWMNELEEGVAQIRERIDSSLASDNVTIGNIELTNAGNSGSRKRRYHDTAESQEPNMKKQAQEVVSNLSPGILIPAEDASLASTSNIVGTVNPKRRSSDSPPNIGR